MSVFVLATLDTKGQEAQYLCRRLRALNVDVCLVDTGCVGEPAVEADIGREELFAAGDYSLADLQAQGDRGKAISAAATAAAELLRREHAAGNVDGVLGIGGSAGSTIATAAMRALPLGVPKLMVSTLASGQVRQYVGDKDILMLNSVVDILGLNRISRAIFDEAARAMAGMVTFERDEPSSEDRPLVAATMFGVTTPCVERAREVLEEAGFEVLVFHATGNGGQAMESLIADGLIAGVLDMTTTELADEVVGGFLSAGPQRLTAATKHGIPQVVSVGATDMVNFHGPETVPQQFASRLFYEHNPTVTLMRTTPEENQRIGAEIGRKLAPSGNRAMVLLPQHGVSAIDAEGKPFDDPQAREALFKAVQENAGDVECRRLDNHINDAAFAETAATELIKLIQQTSPRSRTA